MNQLINFLQSISIPAADKWTGNIFLISRVCGDAYLDTQATFDINTKDHDFYNMSAKAKQGDSYVYSNRTQASKCYLSIGLLEAPCEEGMTQLYVGIHNENHQINSDYFEWLINLPEDENISNSVIVASGTHQEDILLDYTSTQILALLSLLQLDMDFEEHRTGLSYEQIEFNNAAHAYGLDHYLTQITPGEKTESVETKATESTLAKDSQSAPPHEMPNLDDTPPHYYDTHYDGNQMPIEQHHLETTPFLFDHNDEQMQHWLQR